MKGWMRSDGIHMQKKTLKSKIIDLTLTERGTFDIYIHYKWSYETHRAFSASIQFIPEGQNRLNFKNLGNGRLKSGYEAPPIILHAEAAETLEFVDKWWDE